MGCFGFHKIATPYRRAQTESQRSRSRFAADLEVLAPDRGRLPMGPT